MTNEREKVILKFLDSPIAHLGNNEAKLYTDAKATAKKLTLAMSEMKRLKEKEIELVTAKNEAEKAAQEHRDMMNDKAKQFDSIDQSLTQQKAEQAKGRLLLGFITKIGLRI